jgi:tetratricopeptide (TPR) repeat protein
MKSFILSIHTGIILLILSCPLVLGVTFSEEETVLQAKKHFSAAVQYKQKGDSLEALREYERSLSCCDTLYQVHFSFAELLMTMKRMDRAKAEYRRTLVLNPAHYPSAAVLAGMYSTSARYDSALTMYETMYRMQPDKTVLTNIAKLRGYLGKNTEAFQASQSLIEQGEDTLDNLRLASETAVKSGNEKAADPYIQRALIKSPYDRELLYLGVKSSLALGDSAKAIGYLTRFALGDSTVTASLVELEDLCRAAGNRAELIRALERHHQLAPRDTAVIGELAEICIADGELNRGENSVREGLKLTPKDGRLHIILGELYRARKQRDNALAEYKTALGDPNWAVTAQKLIERLQQPQEDPRKKEKDFFERGKVKSN